MEYAFFLLLSAVVHILESKAALIGKDDLLWIYSFRPFTCIPVSKQVTMQSHKINNLNSSPFRSKIITKQLEFTVLLLCIPSRGSDQCLRGKLKQEPEYCWENLTEDFIPEEDTRKHGQLSKLLSHSYMEALVRLCGTKGPEVSSAGQEWSVSKACKNVLPVQLN